MSSLTLTADARELDLLNRELGLYARLSGKTIGETLDKKGRDLGIQLYRGFSEAKWGGSGKAARAVRADMAPYIRRKLIEGMGPFKKLKAS